MSNYLEIAQRALEQYTDSKCGSANDINDVYDKTPTVPDSGRDWSQATAGALLEACRAVGADVRLVKDRPHVEREERLPPALCDEVRRRERGLRLLLVYDAAREDGLREVLAEDGA
jgi:hypothetical protein